MSNTGDATVRFGNRAAAYAQFRPGYDDSLIDAVLDGIVAPTVADIGAGTGISSLALARRGARVIAVEPNDGMRAQIGENASVDVRAGTAHATGLQDKSIDVAACFQAFHWFADDAALEEFARIARRRIAVVQYERDENDRFTHHYGDIVRRYALDETEQRRLKALEFFERRSNNARRVFSASQQLTATELAGRARSSSYLPQSGAAADALFDDLAALFERYERDGYVTLVNATFLLLKELA